MSTGFDIFGNARSGRRFACLLLTFAVLMVCPVTLSPALAAARSTDLSVATRLARQLLREEALPLAQATPTLGSATPGLDRPMVTLGSANVVDMARFWKLRLDRSRSVAFARSHPPRGSHLSESQTGAGQLEQNVIWTRRRLPVQVVSADLEYTFLSLSPGETALRVDSQVLWRPQRTGATRVPSADRAASIYVHRLDARARPSASGLRASGVVRRLIRVVNHLPTLPPESYELGCDRVETSYEVAFRPAPGSLPNAVATGYIGCPQLSLRVGRHQVLLVQRRLVRTLSSILGARITSR